MTELRYFGDEQPLEADPGSDGKYDHTKHTFDALTTTGFFNHIGCSHWQLADLADDYYGHIDVWLTSKKTGNTVGASLRWQETYRDMGTFTVRATEYDAWTNGSLPCAYWIHCYDQHPIDGNPLVVHTAPTDNVMLQCLPLRWFYCAPATRVKAHRHVWTGQTWQSRRS